MIVLTVTTKLNKNITNNFHGKSSYDRQGKRKIEIIDQPQKMFRQQQNKTTKLHLTTQFAVQCPLVLFYIKCHHVDLLLLYIDWHKNQSPRIIYKVLIRIIAGHLV